MRLCVYWPGQVLKTADQGSVPLRNGAFLPDLATACRQFGELRQAGGQGGLSFGCQVEDMAPAWIFTVAWRLIGQVVHQGTGIVVRGHLHRHDGKGQADIVADRVQRQAAMVDIVLEKRREGQVLSAIRALMFVLQAQDMAELMQDRPIGCPASIFMWLPTGR